MTNNTEKIFMSWMKRALVAEERPPGSSDSLGALCRQGGIPLGMPGEQWPKKDGEPLFPILTIAAKELPFIPDFLSGYEYWAIFLQLDEFNQSTKDGSLVVRKYSTLEGLEPILFPDQKTNEYIELYFKEVEDYPSYSAVDCTLNRDNELKNRLSLDWGDILDKYECHSGIKLGGYPLLIQGTAFLENLNPDFQIQIDSTKVYSYCDSGIGYIYGKLSAAIWETM
jgi:hypothetical protein